jgi:hypothetical protein
MGKPRSFGSVALNRIQAVVEDELRWIQWLELELKTKKGDSECRQILTHRATVLRS